MTGSDLLEHMRAKMNPKREPGWYTINELAEGSGKAIRTMRDRVAAGVASGKYERMNVTMKDSIGRLATTNVYRLKPPA